MTERNYNKLSTFMYSVIFLLSIFAWYQYTKDLDLKDTFLGFSPQEWLATKNLDINKLGYSSGLEIYFGSFFMYIYIFFFDVLKIDGLSAEKIIIFFEIGSKVIASYVIVNILFKDDKKIKKDFIAFVFSLFFISGYAFYSDLSRFANPFFVGLFYNIADSLRLIAIALFFSRKFVLSSIFLSLSLITHPLYSLIGVFFLVTIFVVTFKNYTKKDFKYIFLSAGIFLIFLFLTYFNIATNEYLVVSQKVSADNFIHWSLFNNFHWYPVEYGLFGLFHYERFLGFITISILFLYSLYSKDNFTLVDKQILIGWLSMIFLTIIGVYFSWTKESVFMIKLSLTRASLLALEIAILYIVYRFISDILDEKKSLVIRSLSFVLLVSPFLIKAPFSFGASIFLIIYYIFNCRKNLVINSLLIALFGLIFSSFILLGYYYLLGYIDWDYSENYLGTSSMVISFIAISIIFMINKLTMKENIKMIISFGIIVFISFLSFSWLNKNVLLKKNILTIAQDYKDTQLWAEQNTNSNSIFLLDPSLGSAWRLYSKRASFGTYREWTHNAWLYKEDADAYKKGIERLNEYNIDLENERYKIQPRLKQYKNLEEDIKLKYYSFSKEWFDYMSNKYNINYIVMEKGSVKTSLNYDIAFENNSFIIFKIK